MKTVLVTGGAGFVGSHLCDYLLEKNFSVICVDNFITGTKKNIEHLFDSPNFSFLEHNIVEPLKTNEKIDQIYNLASPASPIDFKRLSEEILLVNSFGVKNMLDLALKNKAKFLQASTSEVYGNPLEHPQKESYWGNVNPLGERSCYDEGKRFAEALVLSYIRKHRLDAKIARIFNTYGPRMRANDGRVIPNFITQALNSKPITVYGTGNQSRSFCYISDMIKGLYALMNSQQQGPMNLGSETELTMLQLAERIKKITNSNSEIVLKPLPKDDPSRRKPDISKAKELLKWRPEVTFQDGIVQTINYFSGAPSR